MPARCTGNWSILCVYCRICTYRTRVTLYYEPWILLFTIFTIYLSTREFPIVPRYLRVTPPGYIRWVEAFKAIQHQNGVCASPITLIECLHGCGNSPGSMAAEIAPVVRPK